MVVLDMRGQACPIPVVKSLAKMKEMLKPDILEVHVDNEVAVENLSKMAKSRNFVYNTESRNDNYYVVRIDVVEEAGQELEQIEEDVVIAVSSRYMGNGDEALGSILMKGFIYSLSQLEHLPRAIVFYNSGAFITTEASDSLDDLRAMEEEGVEIITCGTCLDYYKIKDKLAVGEISNMYSIVETLVNAGKVIKP